MRRMYESAGQIRNLLGRKIKMKIRKLETGEKAEYKKAVRRSVFRRQQRLC